MTKYKSSGKSRNRLLIPAATLLLCVLALVGAGYAASVSSVTVNQNTVGTDGIVLQFTDGTDPIATGEFSNEATYDWGSDTVMGASPPTTYYIDAFEDKLIGTATLEIDASKSSITHVNITHTFDTDSDYKSEMDTKIIVKDGATNVVAESDGSFNLDVTKDYVIELYLDFNGKNGLETEPEGFEYSIKITATPIDAPSP